MHALLYAFSPILLGILVVFRLRGHAKASATIETFAAGTFIALSCLVAILHASVLLKVNIDLLLMARFITLTLTIVLFSSVYSFCVGNFKDAAYGASTMATHKTANIALIYVSVYLTVYALYVWYQATLNANSSWDGLDFWLPRVTTLLTHWSENNIENFFDWGLLKGWAFVHPVPASALLAWFTNFGYGSFLYLFWGILAAAVIYVALISSGCSKVSAALGTLICCQMPIAQNHSILFGYAELPVLTSSVMLVIVLNRLNRHYSIESLGLLVATTYILCFTRNTGTLIASLIFGTFAMYKFFCIKTVRSQLKTRSGLPLRRLGFVFFIGSFGFFFLKGDVVQFDQCSPTSLGMMLDLCITPNGDIGVVLEGYTFAVQLNLVGVANALFAAFMQNISYSVLPLTSIFCLMGVLSGRSSLVHRGVKHNRSGHLFLMSGLVLFSAVLVSISLFPMIASKAEPSNDLYLSRYLMLPLTLIFVGSWGGYFSRTSDYRDQAMSNTE